MLAETIPPWLQAVLNRLNTTLLQESSEPDNAADSHPGETVHLFGGSAPNHVLVNEYLAGQGIMPHEDGPLHYPNIATLTLGSHAVIEFQPKPHPDPSTPAQTIRVLLEPNSLFIVRGSMYTAYLHGIASVTEDVITADLANLAQCQAVEGEVLPRATRVSLTMRRVLRVSKLNPALMFGKKR